MRADRGTGGSGTGSAAVEQLAKGADLLVGEMIDMGGTLANVARNSPDRARTRGYVETIRDRFAGTVTLARDLDRF